MRPVTSKALHAFLLQRNMSLTIAYASIGVSDYGELIKAEFVDEQHLGAIARRLGYTPERLAAVVMGAK